MPEDNLEETLETPAEPATEVKETVEGEAPKKREYSDLERQMYARAKKAEDEAKRLKLELEKKAKSNAPDMDAILEITSATAGLEPDEVEELKLRASATGKSLTEARKDKTFNLIIQAMRDERKKANALDPSTRQEGERPRKSPKEMSLAEKEAWLKNLTHNGQSVGLAPRWASDKQT